MLRGGVLGRLQIGVDQVVGGVQFFAGLPVAPSACRGGEVGLNGIRPVADSGKRMRWHVQRMRRRRSDLTVALCRPDRPRSQRGNVVRVNDVVSQSWMIWILNEQAFKYCAGLQLFRIRLIGGVGGGSKGQRIED